MTSSPSPGERIRDILDEMIATNLEGFVAVAEATALRPDGEALRRAFESNLTRLDRLLGLRAKLQPAS